MAWLVVQGVENEEIYKLSIRRLVVKAREWTCGNAKISLSHVDIHPKASLMEEALGNN